MWQKRFLWIGALAGALLTQSATPALGQQSDPVIDPLDSRVIEFFGLVTQKRVQTAYEGLLDAEKIFSKEDRKTLEDETTKIDKTYGAYRGVERVYTKQVGNDLVFMKYLYKCSMFPVLWHVTFYRPPASELGSGSRSWQVVSIRFDTDLEMLTLLSSDK